MKKRRIAGMIAGGLGLSLFLYVGLSLADRLSDDDGESGPTTPVTPIAASLTPVTILSVTETAPSPLSGDLSDGTGLAPLLRLSGTAEPGAVIVLSDRGERVRQVKTDEAGAWSTSLFVPDAPMAVEAVLFAGAEGGPQTSIRGEQTVFRIHRQTDREAGAPALIMVSAPAAPTRVVSSPFGGLPGSGPLYLSAIDYDDAGGVIFSGLSETPGRVRLYVSGAAIGETRVGADGRWAYIAASVMPLGEYDVRAELLPEPGLNGPGSPAGERVSVSVSFERLPPMTDTGGGDDGGVSVEFKPHRWQIRRTLVGGGVQSTAIFSPE